MRIYKDLFKQIIEPENLFIAWKRFRRGKDSRTDVFEFEKNLEPEIFQLYRQLQNKTYRHSGYTNFFISDPKRRHIHKARVRDRVLHHAIYQILYWVFEPTFIKNSFSCRLGKGTHKGVLAVEKMLRQESKNYSKPCHALKCDIKKFFDSVDHQILISVLQRKIKDRDLLDLLKEIIGSYTIRPAVGERERESKNAPRIGIPIGNLTSQLFANIYMNEFDQFMKHDLRVKNYARYTDDFVIISEDLDYLKSLLPKVEFFLGEKLVLKLHPEKVIFRKFGQGVDFLGYVIMPHHKILRVRTKKRMLRKLGSKVKDYENNLLSKENLESSLHSYLGVLSHANGYILGQELKNWIYLLIRKE